MPKFQFDKLVRDKLPDRYQELGQKIVFRRLVGVELLKRYRDKLIEESTEIPFETSDRQKIIQEISDVYQVLDDIKAEQGISDDEIEAAKQKKFAKKGGFSDGIYVETIELDEDDEWVGYYRREPLKYKEHGIQSTPTVEPGIYVHYKSDDKRYEVFGVGRHSETGEHFVVYKPLYETEDEQPDFWVRPYEMFIGDVTVDGKTMPRFRRIDE